MTAPRIRAAAAADLDALHRINESSTPGVGTLSLEALSGLLDDNASTWVAESAGAPIGFVLCLVEGAGYASPNYAWLSERYPSFAYVDRVAVAPEARNRGLGATLYRAVSEHFAVSKPVLLAEINLAPPNPGSVRFHERMGFSPVGERWENPEKGVVYVEKSLSQAPLPHETDPPSV